MKKIIGLLEVELIFFLNKTNYLYLALITVLFTIELFLDFWSSQGNSQISINAFIISNHLGKIGFANSIFFLWGLTRDFKIKRLQNFIINGYSSSEIFLLKLIHACLLSVSSVISYLIANFILNYWNSGVPKFTLSILDVVLYFLVTIYISMFLFFLFCLTKHFLFSIICFIVIGSIEQISKILFPIDQPAYLPISTLKIVFKTNTLNSFFLCYTLFFILSSYLYIRKIKNWDSF